MREEAEQKHLKTVLELQYILDKLGDDEVRSDLKQGTNGVPVLTEAELSTLDEFYKLVEPERDMNVRYNRLYWQNNSDKSDEAINFSDFILEF